MVKLLKIRFGIMLLVAALLATVMLVGQNFLQQNVAGAVETEDVAVVEQIDVVGAAEGVLVTAEPYNVEAVEVANVDELPEAIAALEDVIRRANDVRVAFTYRTLMGSRPEDVWGRFNGHELPVHLMQRDFDFLAKVESAIIVANDVLETSIEHFELKEAATILETTIAPNGSYHNPNNLPTSWLETLPNGDPRNLPWNMDVAVGQEWTWSNELNPSRINAFKCLGPQFTGEIQNLTSAIDTSLFHSGEYWYGNCGLYNHYWRLRTSHNEATSEFDGQYVYSSFFPAVAANFRFQEIINPNNGRIEQDHIFRSAVGFQCLRPAITDNPFFESDQFARNEDGFIIWELMDNHELCARHLGDDWQENHIMPGNGLTYSERWRHFPGSFSLTFGIQTLDQRTLIP
jgi:hypothetical protein